MRNSSPALTMNFYTDPRLSDVSAAVDASPTFELVDVSPKTSFAIN